MNGNTYILVLVVLLVVFLVTIYGISRNEYYTNFVSPRKNNLIHNGSFGGGKDIVQKVKSEGSNQIVVLENPGQTSYVLKQTQTRSGELYYLLRVQIEQDEHYQLAFWYSCQNGSDLEETLLKLEIKDKNHQTHVIQGNTLVKEKAKVGDLEWYQVAFHFQVPSNLLDNYLYVYLGYNMTNGTRYYTDVSLVKYLTDAPRFKVTQGLQVFLEGPTVDMAERIHNTVWKDVSEKGNDFTWENRPNYHPDGFYKTYGNSLVGPSGMRILGEGQFSFGINMELTESAKRPIMAMAPGLTNLTENMLLKNYREVLWIPGNNKYALRVLLPLYYGKMILQIADDKYETDTDVIGQNNNVYFFNYDGHSMKIYVNNALISTIVPKNKIHFSHQPIVINENKNMRANLYNVMVYNRVITSDELGYVVKYLRRGGVAEKGLVQRWFHHLTGRNENQERKQEHDDKQSKQMEQLEPSCQMTNGGGGGNKKCSIGECPKVVYKTGQYWVYIPSGSRLEKLLGYCGYKSYGKDQANARKMFQVNFPECRVPDILVQPRRHKNFHHCPYLVREGNPCFSQACAGVDWSKRKPGEAHLSEACKRDINHYCETYNTVDPACYCWKPPNRDQKECVDFRRQFLNPSDYACKVSDFNLEEHPDMGNYIRKDRIPCWGCTLGTKGDCKGKTLSRNWKNFGN